MNTKITLDRVMDACAQDDNIGFCLYCGNEQGGCEPDARNYRCEACGMFRVHGAEEVLFMIQA